ncbi:MAG: hypothetical protein WCO68_07145 [Verrucomicrobiota bacterium]
MDQLILIVVVGVIAFVKWFVENAGQSAPDETRPPSPRPLRPDPADANRAESEAERMRRFMEALGLPPDAVPPAPPRKPPIQPRTPAPPVSKPLRAPGTFPRKGRPVDPFPRPAAPAHRPDIAPPLETGGPLPTLPKTASVRETAPSMEVTSIPQMTFAEPEQAVQSAAAAVAASTKALSGSASQALATPSTPSALREQLREPDSLRKAILLREILGAPKGLQSAQSPSIFSPL